MFAIRERVMIGAILALLALVGFQDCQTSRAERRAAESSLARDTLVASLDSSRSIALSRRDSLAILGDTLTATQRRIVQREQERDALDRALDLERIATANLRTEIRTIRTTATSAAPVVTDNGTRTASFVVEQAPYTARLAVSLPAVGHGTVDLTISTAPASISLRIACGDAVDGIRPATAIATGPAWLTVTLGRVEQSPDLCRSPALDPPDRRSILRRLVARVGVVAGYGGAVSGGQVRAGPIVGVGVKVWP